MEKLELSHSALIGGELALAWSDGKETYLTLEALRKACPCASCQGEPDVTGKVVRPQVTYHEGSFELRRYELVGGYAIQFFWADGHSTGIYGYEYLRGLAENP
ncbi:MAG: DUF971 domain-containing protein [Verrucomicrobiales bacterium]